MGWGWSWTSTGFQERSKHGSRRSHQSRVPGIRPIPEDICSVRRSEVQDRRYRLMGGAGELDSEVKLAKISKEAKGNRPAVIHCHGRDPW